MAAHSGPLIQHVVVDSAAFIKRARLETFGSCMYTTPQVIAEIRDAQTRASLKCLAYTLRLEAPTKESIQIVSDMSKKTGDFSVLSTTDLGVIALTYELHKRYVGEPQPKPVVPLPDNLGAQARARPPPSDGSDDDDDNDSESNSEAEESEDAGSHHSAGAKESEQEETDDLPSADDWITEHNFDEKAVNNFGLGNSFLSEQFQSLNGDAAESVPVVACLTTDFAMQNVLFHLGLDLISLNGLKIVRPRTYLLWCGSCFRPTKRTDTYFCPFCAQANLRRIPVTLHEDGRLEFHFSRRFVKSLRGLQQPIRRPRGGKHADEPIYCPDQRLPDRRPAKPKHPHVQPVATNGLLELEDSELAGTLDDALGFGLGDVDGLAAFPLHDVTSRSARIGIRSDHQIPQRSWYQPNVEHGLKPTRGTAHLPKPRTGNKKKRSKNRVF